MELLPFAFVIGGLALLIFGSELLVRGAARLARSIGIRSFIVGLTVVAFGTSAPELAGSLRAAYSGNGGIAIGNVVGSNIANICLILGAAAAISPIPLKIATVRREVFVMIATALAAAGALYGGQTSRLAGGLLVAGLVVFTWGAYVRGRRAGPDEATDMVNAAHELDEELDNVKPSSWPKSVLMVLIGLGMLILGSEQLVNGATDIAKMLGVSDAVIGLTLVALGTSLPELSLSVIAAFRKQSDIAIGNVLGSNIFNVLGVLGLTSLVAPVPLPVSPEIWQRDIWVMIGVSLACLPIVAAGTRVSRAEGLVLLGLYGVYLGVLVVQSLGAAPQSPA